MVRRPRAVALAMMAATALALTTGSVATATEDTSSAASSFVLTLTPGPGGTSTPSSATLECEPAGGSHPTPQAACDSLAKVRGDFSALPSLPGWVCSANYDPVIATAQGTWRGMPVSYREQFSNGCVAWVSTDGIFRF